MYPVPYITGMAASEYTEYLASLTDDELENERYTLTHERWTLYSLTDDDVADRVAAIETLITNRVCSRI